MGYRIIYDDKAAGTHSRIPIFTLGFFLLFLAGLLALRKPTVFWPESLEAIAAGIHQGSIREAIECFCMELTGNG